MIPDQTRNDPGSNSKWSRIKLEIIPDLTGYVSVLNEKWFRIKLEMIPEQTGNDSRSNSKKFRIKLEKILDQTGNHPGSNWIITDPSGIEPGSNWKYSGTKKWNAKYKIWVNWVSTIVHCEVASVLKPVKRIENGLKTDWKRIEK